MKRIPFFVLDSFTDTPFAGNPAGVFLDDDACLSDAEMRTLTAEISLESAFVLPAGAEGADLRLRYFTGETEVPLCGHATVAALAALARVGRIPAVGNVRVATPVGVLTAHLEEASEPGVSAAPPRVTLMQNAPQYGTPLDSAGVVSVATALGCALEAILATGLPVLRVSTGTPWLFAPVASRAAVDRAPGDLQQITELSRRQETFGLYVFTVERDEAAGQITTWGRCFAPIAGLDEDPVTGSASGALGCYLAAQGLLRDTAADRDGMSRFVARQGFAGKRGGTVQIGIGRDEAGRVDRVAITGGAVPVAEGGVFTLF